MEQKNVPLTHEQVKALPMQKRTVTDAKGREKVVYLAAHQSELPNHRTRRQDKQRGPHRNAKQTEGRIHQTVEIMAEQTTKFGPVKAPTGFTRKIIHQVAVMNEYKASLRLQATRMAKEHPLQIVTDEQVADNSQDTKEAA
jgi:hypothetical protein